MLDGMAGPTAKSQGPYSVTPPRLKAFETRLIVRPGNLERAQTMFPCIKIADQGYKYLGFYAC